MEDWLRHTRYMVDQQAFEDALTEGIKRILKEATRQIPCTSGDAVDRGAGAQDRHVESLPIAGHQARPEPGQPWPQWRRRPISEVGDTFCRVASGYTLQ